MLPKVVVILGPTASGKSALAVEIARAVGGEVISADSRQVYRGLDIGTGKITKHEMRGIPHHLLDVVSPKRTFTADDFARLGRKAVIDITKRGKVPIICGGTGFYIDALVGRVQLADTPPNPRLRARLKKHTAQKLFHMLEKLDPKRAVTIDQNNKHRLIRAIEIAKALGKIPPLWMSDIHRSGRQTSTEYEVTWIGIRPDDKTLREKVHVRLHSRIRSGMIAEAKQLHAAGLSFKRMNELGLEYRHLAQFSQGKVTKAQMLSKLETDIWRFSKRQITYWGRNTDIQWFPPQKQKSILKAIMRFLHTLNNEMHFSVQT